MQGNRPNNEGALKAPNIKSTARLINQLHHGQTDKGGHAYVAHPLRVAENVKSIYPVASEDMLMAAMLHDTIEDCGIDEEYLRGRGYSESCIVMVSLLSKPENDPRSYNEVIDDLITSGNRGAMIIKIADNIDNLHPDRVQELKQIDPTRAKKLGERYHASIEKLCLATGLDLSHVKDAINSAKPIKAIAPTNGMKDEFMAQTYKYYLLGDTLPVRVAFNDKGQKMGAEVPDRERGGLAQKATYLSRLERSWEVEEITEEQFNQRCEGFLGSEAVQS